MSDDESFLTRWSRRKRDVAEGRAVAEPAPPPITPAEGEVERDGDEAASSRPVTDAGTSRPLVDLSKLPTIESITAETDISGFLAPGVPAELTRAALRRAWSADTSIRDFIGLVENDWDVLAPAAAGGTQPLVASEAMRRMVGELFSPSPAPDDTTAPRRDPAGSDQSLPVPVESAAVAVPETAPAEEVTAASEAPSERPTGQSVADSGHPDAARQIDIAVQDDGEQSRPSGVAVRRGHGRALPT
jgi:hypothetical protein